MKVVALKAEPLIVKSTKTKFWTGEPTGTCSCENGEMKRSSGILLFRRRSDACEFFLVHPGGPFWKKKDEGAWSIPKGEYDGGEDSFAAAKREFQEEVGMAVDGDFLPLGDVKQPGGKIVTAWGLLHDIDPGALRSNTFSLEWPPKSGRFHEFPEVDRAEWFDRDNARRKILRGQVEFLDRLERILSGSRA